MSTITESVTVEAPTQTAYDQWAQYETLPRFADSVLKVERVSANVSHWKVQIAGVNREFDAEVVERVPNRRIAWHSVTGPAHAGIVEFEPVDATTTKVTAAMEIAPEGFVENVGDKLGVINLGVKRDLHQFKTFVENKLPPEPGSQPGQWVPPVMP